MISCFQTPKLPMFQYCSAIEKVWCVAVEETNEPIRVLLGHCQRQSANNTITSVRAKVMALSRMLQSSE